MKLRSAIMKKAIVLFTAIAVLLPGITYAADMTINYISFVRRNHIYVKLYKKNFKEIEKRSNGRLKFRYRGGPESIKIFDQAMAVKRGATDMVLTTPSFTGKIVKGPPMLTLSKQPSYKHREIGLYDFLNEVYNPVGLQFIIVVAEPAGQVFRMMTKDKITKTDQFYGKFLRGGDWMDAIAPEFGMQTLAIRFGEDYTAIERGLIHIARSTINSMESFKVYEVAKYLVKTGWGSAPASWLMNKKKWDAMPKDLQDLFLDAMYEQAVETEKLLLADIKRIEKLLISKGVEVVALEDEDKFLEVSEKKMYEYFMRDNPEASKRIYELSQ